MSHFLFKAGAWKGSGVVTFSHSPEQLPYVLRWKIEQDGEGFQAEQEVEVEGIPPMCNRYSIVSGPDVAFSITLVNEVLGTFSGTGLLQDEKLAWEFSHPGQLEGLEAYERMPEGEYVFHSEYSGGDGFVTKISGTLFPLFV